MARLEALVPVLDEIAKKNGGCLRPRDVVKEARSEGSVLHPCFEWDDSIAAEAHRVSQARELIRRVSVPAIRSDGKTVDAPRWVTIVVEKHDAEDDDRDAELDGTPRSPREEVVYAKSSDMASNRSLELQGLVTVCGRLLDVLANSGMMYKELDKVRVLVSKVLGDAQKEVADSAKTDDRPGASVRAGVRGSGRRPVVGGPRAGVALPRVPGDVPSRDGRAARP